MRRRELLSNSTEMTVAKISHAFAQLKTFCACVPDEDISLVVSPLL
jgi:hypothetical protein